MKLLGIIVSVLVGGTIADSLSSINQSISQKYSQFTKFKTSRVDDAFLGDVDGYLQSDLKSHNTIKGVRAIKLMPDAGECGLHWSLCPNMCNLNETLQNYFSDIRGNKMTKYQQWKTETAMKKRAILKDLEGKLDQVEGLEDELRKNGLDLERREDLFISLLDGHIEKALQIREDLTSLKEDYAEIAIELTQLSIKIDAAHTDCFDQAPCMAVPKCKLGVASGASCAEIASNGMDKDDQGEATLNKETAVHIIQPAGLEAVAAICEFDYTGTGFTVVQNRHNNTGRFNGDFENGFGVTVGYDDAECAVANYYLGNKYVRAITTSESSLKVKHTNGVEQWNKVSVSGKNLNLNGGGHVCGDNTMSASEVTLGGGGINGNWAGQTQILIGKDRSPDMDVDCMELGGGSDGGSSDSSDYGSKGGGSSSYY